MRTEPEAKDHDDELGTAPIPRERYTSAAFLQEELRGMWPRVWQCAAPSAYVAEVGACTTYEIAGDSFLIVRTRDGVHAFHNVCRHRGRRLRDPGCSNAPTFRCPYHHWEWSLDGKLLNIPRRERFRALPVDASLGLHEVAAAEWGGFVWIHPDRAAEPLDAYLGAVMTRLAPYRLEDYALASYDTLEIECNWKVSVDAANESYHLAALHPEILGVVDPASTQIELLGIHSAATAAFGAPAGGAPQELNEALKHMLREAGLDPAGYTGPASGVRAAVQRAMRARPDLDVSALDDEQLVDNFQYYVFPNLTLNVWALRLLVLRHRPHPTDPGRMFFDVLQLLRCPRGTTPPRPTRREFRYGGGSLGDITDQDTFNFLRVQQGMQSSGGGGLLLGDDEIRIRHMHHVIDRYLARR